MTAQRVCALSDLVQDEARRVEVDGVAIALVLDSSGEVHAIGDVCTHGDISLRRRRVARMLGSRLGVLAAHRQAPQSPRVRAGPGVRGHRRRR
jgi:hypothetical protein